MLAHLTPYCFHPHTSVSLFSLSHSRPLFSGQTRSLNYLHCSFIRISDVSGPLASSRLKTLIAQGLERKSWIIYNNVAVDHNLIRTCDGKYFTNKFLANSSPVANRVLKHPLPLFKELLFQGLTLCVHSRY